MSTQVKNSEEFQKILNGSKPVLVDFYADWCGPCKMLAPTIEEISGEKNDDIVVCKVNVDENQDLAQKYSVQSIPTLICFKNGEINKKSVGLVSKEEVLKLLD